MHVYFRFIHSNDQSALLEPPLDLFGGMYSIIVLQSRIVINISIKKKMMQLMYSGISCCRQHSKRK